MGWLWCSTHSAERHYREVHHTDSLHVYSQNKEQLPPHHSLSAGLVKAGVCVQVCVYVCVQEFTQHWQQWVHKARLWLVSSGAQISVELAERESGSSDDLTVRSQQQQQQVMWGGAGWAGHGQKVHMEAKDSVSVHTAWVASNVFIYCNNFFWWSTTIHYYSYTKWLLVSCWWIFQTLCPFH